jgi:fructose-1,6-bisphosphatase
VQKSQHHSNEVLIEANEWVSGRHGVRKKWTASTCRTAIRRRIAAALNHLTVPAILDFNVSIGTIFSVLKSLMAMPVRKRLYSLAPSRSLLATVSTGRNRCWCWIVGDGA